MTGESRPALYLLLNLKHCIYNWPQQLQLVYTSSVFAYSKHSCTYRVLWKINYIYYISEEDNFRLGFQVLFIYFIRKYDISTSVFLISISSIGTAYFTACEMTKYNNTLDEITVTEDIEFKLAWLLLMFLFMQFWARWPTTFETAYSRIHTFYIIYLVRVLLSIYIRSLRGRIDQNQ
jgi:hypothetical protein